MQGSFTGRFVKVRYDAVETDFATAVEFDIGEVSPVDGRSWTVEAASS